MQSQTGLVFQIQTELPDKETINLSNQFQYCPFFIQEEKKELLVQEDWYNSNLKVLDDFTEVVKENKYTMCLTKDFPSLHEVQNQPLFWALYSSYASKFDYDIWLKMLSPTPQEVFPGVKKYMMQDIPIFVMTLKKFHATALKDLGTKRVITDRRLSKDDLEDFEDLFPPLQKVLNLLGESGAFVKSHSKSCKNDLALKPLKTPEDIIDNLTASKDILSRWRESNNLLIMMPFIENLDRMREFRVIILNRKIAGISQQSWYKSLDWTPDEATFKAIQKLWEDELNAKLYHADVVLDVYIDNLGVARLIECNPGGVWCSSGSALFSWVTDQEILLNPDVIPFRIYKKPPCETTVTDSKTI